MKLISPLLKGLITAALMIVATLLFHYTKQQQSPALTYIVYGLYAAGILWTLFSYAASKGYTAKFGELFSQGFRCFVIVTLVMVAFTAIFSMTHPEMAEESAVYLREDLVKQKNKTPAEIDSEVARYKKQYTTTLVSISVFGSLIIGAVFTTAGAAIVLMKRK